MQAIIRKSEESCLS